MMLLMLEEDEEYDRYDDIPYYCESNHWRVINKIKAYYHRRRWKKLNIIAVYKGECQWADKLK